jgi:hypothetical protein
MTTGEVTAGILGCCKGLVFCCDFGLELVHVGFCTGGGSAMQGERKEEREIQR